MILPLFYGSTLILISCVEIIAYLSTDIFVL